MLTSTPPPLCTNGLSLHPLLQDEELSDLSDGDGELSSYIATKEEAELKGLLWTEMNR